MTAFNRTSYGEDVPVHAVTDARLQCLGYQQIPAASTTVAVSLTVPSGARIAVVDVEAQNIRWRDDGAAPTATVGMRWMSDNEYVYSGNLSAIQFINESAGTILNISYYG